MKDYQKLIKDLPNKVGLTGGVASGKSTVSEILIKNSFVVLDFDKIAAEVRSLDSVKAQLISIFKTDDPQELGKIIFNDKEKKAKLENILSNPILDRAILLTQLNSKLGNKPVIWDSALLIDFDLHQAMDYNILVVSTVKNRLDRLMARDKISEEFAMKIISSQTSDEQKIAKIQNTDHSIITNNSTLIQVTAQVNNLIDMLRRKYV